MIYESSFWKDDLLKQAKSLRFRISQKRWPATSFARLEQTVMLGFYSIRKLIEAKKLSDEVANQTVNIFVHSWKGEAVTRINRHDFWELYDLDKTQQVQKNLLFLCHQFVHSYIFQISFDESNKFNGVFVSSDKERHVALYFVEVNQIIGLFEQIGKDYPRIATMTFNEKKRDYDFVPVVLS